MSEERELVKKRGSFKGRLTAFVNFLDSLKEQELTNCVVSELQLRVGKIESLYEQYDEETYSVNLNQPYMLGTSVRIVSMKGCQKIEGQIELKGGKNHFDWFHRYAICTMGQGDVDVDGNYVGYQAGRDNLKKSEMPDYKMIDKLFNDKEYMRNLKPNGFCQNDHGGPLVTWMGGVEYLIGIASTFFVNAENMQCIPPFRYTSVRLTSRYINCSLSASSRRSSLGDCDTSIVLERNDAPIGQTHEP